MNWTIALGVAFVVVALGGVAAVLWWRLADKAVSYRDQHNRPANKREDVVVIKNDPHK